ncbi:MAG: hypothetical protein PF692_13390 [Kiritimatiellae bacterium]|jgi:hypothetical protein|nr:hypothetical protein [Kiritimatiellia bacterium]
MNLKNDSLCKLLYVLLFMIFIISLIFNIFSANKIVYMDERDYVAISENIYKCHQYLGYNQEITAYRAPLYPLVLSTLSWIGSNKVIAMKILNSIFLALTAFIYGLIVFRDSKSRVSQVICTLIIAIYPIFYFTSSLLYPQIFGAMLFGLISWMILKKDLSTKGFVLAGLLYGLLILAIPSFILTIPIVALFVFFSPNSTNITQEKVFRSPKFVSRATKPLIFVLVAAFVVLCWTARNAHVFKTFIPVSTNSGFNLFVGNSENAKYNAGTAIDWTEQRLVIEENNYGELEKDQYFKDEAISWIKENPQKCIKLYFAKVLNYFNYTNKMFVENQESKFKDIILFCSYIPLLFLAILRLFFIAKMPLTRTEKYLYIIYFGTAFTSAIFFTRLRFRIPFDFLLIAIVSLFIHKVINHKINRAA